MTAGFRALSRLRRSSPDATSTRAASTQLLLVAEHTWGLDLKTHWPDTTHWSAAELASVRDDPAVVSLEASWADQDRYLDAAAELLGGEAVATLAATRAPVTPHAARVVGLAEVTGTACRLGRYDLVLDPDDGAVVGGDLASPEVPLGRFRIDSFDAADYDRWFGTYNAGTRPEDLDWARWDNTKPGLEHSAAVSRTWSPRLRSVHAGRRDDAEVVVISLGPPDDLDASSPVAWPAEVTVELRVAAADASTVEVELAWRDKPACTLAGIHVVVRRAGGAFLGGLADAQARRRGVARRGGVRWGTAPARRRAARSSRGDGRTARQRPRRAGRASAAALGRRSGGPIGRLVAVRARQPVGHELRDVGPGRRPVPDPDQAAGGLSSSSRSSTEPTSQPVPTGRSTPR